MSNKQNKTQTKKNTGRKSGPVSPNGSAKTQQKKKAVIGKANAPPLAVSKSLTSSRAPRQSFIKNGVRVEMEELIGIIQKPATEDTLQSLVQVMRLRINPGSKKTFNWLSTIAPSYENFRFHKCELVYLPRTSSLTTGSLIMAPDYDAEDGDVAVSEQALFANKGSVDRSLWDSSILKLNPSALNRLYKAHVCMSDERFDLTSQDAKTIDPAQVFICVETDDTAPTKYGKLVIRYTVDLLDPQNPTDPVNAGGLALKTNQPLGAASLKPFQNAIPSPGTVLNGLKVDKNLMVPAFNLPTAVFPNATIGQFIKDYSGTLTTSIAGTGLSGWSDMYVGPEKNLNLDAGTAGDIIQSLSNIIVQSGNTNYQSRTFDIVAKAGDLLRMKSTPATTITGFNAVLGGSSSLEL